MKRSHRLLQGLSAAVLAVAGLPAHAAGDQDTPQDHDLKLQATYVWQHKDAVRSPYASPNSLLAAPERSYSFSGTAAFGARVWPGGEVYANAEVGQGVPLSGLTGLAGFTNGEIARTSGPKPKLYLARLFLRQSWNLGGESEFRPSDFNQLAGTVDRRRVVLTAGVLSVIDLFDQNGYNHDPRTQFLNWALFTHGAYDFAADARGYTRGAAVEYFHDDWVLRAGRFMQPREPNQQALDTRLLRHYGDQVELEHAHRLGDREGRLRVLAYRNRTVMARYDDAIALARQTGGVPDITQVRNGPQTRTGFGLSLEQSLHEHLGLFARAMRTSGQTETYAFTEIDRSAAMGLLARGEAWGREGDTAGVGVARNQLSAARRSYLEQGGISYFIGDGALRYRPEQITEAFYSVAVSRSLWVTLDGQYIRNPAYNADRGPVRVASVRFHAEF